MTIPETVRGPLRTGEAAEMLGLPCETKAHARAIGVLMRAAGWTFRRRRPPLPAVGLWLPRCERWPV